MCVCVCDMTLDFDAALIVVLQVVGGESVKLTRGGGVASAGKRP